MKFQRSCVLVLGLTVPVPVWVLAFGGIVFGLIMMGQRVINTVGSGITEITPSRGFAAQFGAATAVLVCSRMGLPVSTTHCLVGAVVGVALVRGIAAVDARTVRKHLRLLDRHRADCRRAHGRHLFGLSTVPYGVR